MVQGLVYHFRQGHFLIDRPVHLAERGGDVRIIEHEQRDAQEQGARLVGPHGLGARRLRQEDAGEQLEIGNPLRPRLGHEIKRVVAVRTVLHRRPLEDPVPATLAPIAGRDGVVFVLDIQHDHGVLPKQ